MTNDTGSVVTVDGPIPPADLGVTLSHEHTFANWVEAWYTPPETAHDQRIAEQPISIDSLGYVRRNPMQHRDNLRLDSVEEAIDELARYLRAGGESYVDVTPKNVGCDPERVRGIARQLGLNVVHGTGYYTQAAHPPDVTEATIEELEEEFVSDVRDGIGETDVRAGIIGEIGLSDRIYGDEEKVLRGAARAARRTGAALTIHPPGRSRYSQRERTYPTSRWGLEVLDMVREEGLAPDRVIMDHMDRTIYEDLTYQKQLADQGVYLEYDIWGLESYLAEHEDSYPQDSWRTRAVLELIEEGYLENLLFSHDVYLKIQRVAHGGYGYAHLLENVVPMLEARGVTDDQLETIFVENTRRVLTFAEGTE